MRANAEKESKEQHVSMQAIKNYLPRYLERRVDSTSLGTASSLTIVPQISMQKKQLVEAKEQIERLEEEVKHLKAMQVKLVAVILKGDWKYSKATLFLTSLNFS